MVVCVHLPRFELVVAAGDRSVGGGPVEIVQQALAGRAMAVAPTLGAEQRVGEVSGAAEACGVGAGMVLGEALARCPELVLVAPDPVGAAETWEGVLRALESIGAAVEPARPGLAYFETAGLRGIHGTDAATIAAARHACRSAGRSEHRGTEGEAPGRRPRPNGGRPVRIGGGPTRFCALAAALAVRSRRALVIEGPPTQEARRWLAGRPIGLLGFREETAALVEPLTRLGVRTLGELAKLGREALSDRFGAAGVLAHRLACGEDSRLRARRVEERLEESMEVGDASSGSALKGVLNVLVNRLLARPERRGRTLRAVILSARLAAGGGWRERVVFRQALSDPERIRLALSVRLLLLPAPAGALRLSVEGFGPPASDQGALLDEDRVARAARLREAVAQMRAVAGADAALRAVCVDPDSRVPERRVMLAPVGDGPVVLE
jgi:nucleotidyltransferase/DNA polymerase involved in DNA repair